MRPCATNRLILSGPGTRASRGRAAACGFQPYTLAAGASSGEIQMGINKTDWTVFNELDDYSYSTYSTGASYIDWTKVTVYQGGTLIWGTEP
jgi:cellulose 1,4-beta-cellobiosidase